ncbi:MAG: carbohydrate ABC transporter permease, partial [Anaerolineae bacterium]|nr:carbohydrate ABC transporter permease [Anaerolineae bacterium]
LQVFASGHNTEWGLLMAASTMVVAPVIVIFFLAQKSFVRGITMTGMKA